MVKRLKKISEEVLHKNPWWTYKHDTFETPSGGEGHYYYGEMSGFALVVPVLDDGRIVLALQYRYLTGKQSIEFPGGGIEEGQEPIDAARAELVEETGCTATDFVKIGQFETDNGFLRNTCHLYLAHVDAVGPQAAHDETEEIEVVLRRPEDVDRMMASNEIWDGVALAAWTLARPHVMKVHQENTLNDPFVSRIEQHL